MRTLSDSTCSFIARNLQKIRKNLIQIDEIVETKYLEGRIELIKISLDNISFYFDEEIEEIEKLVDNNKSGI